MTVCSRPLAKNRLNHRSRYTALPYRCQECTRSVSEGTLFATTLRRVGIRSSGRLGLLPPPRLRGRGGVGGDRQARNVQLPLAAGAHGSSPQISPRTPP